MEEVQEEPAVRGDDDHMEQVTPPQVASNSVLTAPGAPVKKKGRSSATGKLKPRKLIYSSSAEEQVNKPIQDSGKSVPLSQEMQELLETRINTTEGTWVQCDHPGCNKWRYLADVIDPSELPEKWYCSMNKDPKHNSCEAEEDDLPDDDLLEAKYFVGSVVWARVNTYPWWPAMIDDDPDLGVYEWREGRPGLPTHYHVTFLDQNVTRAWVRESNCMAFHLAHNHDGPARNKVPGHFRRAFDAAVETAELAMKLPVAERIKKYCFLNCYPDICKCLPLDSKAKRPRKRSHANQETEKEEPAHSRTKQLEMSVKQGVKRPRGRPRKNANTEESQPACPTPKQPKVSSKKAQDPQSGATAQDAPKKTLSKQVPPLKKAGKRRLNDMPSEFVQVPSVEEAQGNAQKTFKPKTKMTSTISSLPPTATTASSSIKDTAQDSENTAGQMQAGPQTKGNGNVAEMFSSDSDSKQGGKAQGARKKTTSNLAGPAKQVVRPDAKAMKSTLASSKPGIKRAQDSQKRHKLNTNKTTMASSSTEDTMQNSDKTANQMQEEHQSKDHDNAATTSEQSLFLPSGDHEGTVSSEAATMEIDSNHSESMFETPQPPALAFENDQQNLPVAAPLPSKCASKDDNAKHPKPSDVTHMPADNIATNHATYADMAPASAQSAEPVKSLESPTYSHSWNGVVETVTEAIQSLSNTLTDEEPQPECFPDINLVLDFLDTDITTDCKPKLSSLNKAAEAVCTNMTDKAHLPNKAMGLETARTNLGTAPEKVPNETSMQGNALQDHGTEIALATAPKKLSEIHYGPKLSGPKRAEKLYALIKKIGPWCQVKSWV
ncbi:hypothetical protein V5799_018228 [Amblyomma americanum]|uniref:Zinc finger CW-type PWWP domain protein 1-like n=1 Tax=Amblyomma americanum TaxID=6943 RepID=A0AAQ4F0C3_AMBAM